VVGADLGADLGDDLLQSLPGGQDSVAELRVVKRLQAARIRSCSTCCNCSSVGC
jgi:hypothetical protein